MTLSLVIAVAAIIAGAFLAGLFFLFRTVTRSMEDALTRSRMESQQSLQLAMDGIQNRIEGVRTQVDQKLSETITKNFESFGAVSKRLEELQAVTGQVVGLSQGVRELSKILESPKLRGAMGEFQLGEMLRQVLPADVYEEQFAIDPRSKEAVDAVIKLKEGYLCIDSKFPLNNARQILENALPEDELKTYRKAFQQDVKAMAESIASKYIIPEKTLDFALMFIPAESVFYELMKDGDLHQYCLKKHVIPVSPNSFYAYLQAIAVGFRGLKIQGEAKKIEGALLRLKSDFQKFQADFAKVGKHLKDAQTQYGNVEDRVEKFGATIDKLGLSSNGPEAGAPVIGSPVAADAEAERRN